MNQDKFEEPLLNQLSEIRSIASPHDRRKNRMKTRNNFEFKQEKYMPVFPKASGKPTIFIEGYPCEDDEPMSATGFHDEQIGSLSEQIKRYFAINPHIYVGVDSFIYYREGDLTKCVAPDIYVVLGVNKYPQRRSFYTWSEGAAPTTVFEFLSDSTARQDRNEKVQIYLGEMEALEYFIHQPELKKPAEFRGWRRSTTGTIVEIAPDAEGGLFSETLNLGFRWEAQMTTHVRLLRPYFPDGTPLTTSLEEQHLREAAERRATAESERRRAAEEQATAESERRRAAEERAREAAEQRQEIEAELERLRAQLATPKHSS